jgi:hypothetical protein
LCQPLNQQTGAWHKRLYNALVERKLRWKLFWQRFGS